MVAKMWCIIKLCAYFFWSTLYITGPCPSVLHTGGWVTKVIWHVQNTECRNVGGGDITGAFQALEFQQSPPSPPSFHAAAKSRTVSTDPSIKLSTTFQSLGARP